MTALIPESVGTLWGKLDYVEPSTLINLKLGDDGLAGWA